MSRWIPLMLVAALGSGCAWSVGGSKAETYDRPTIGMELVDLEKAYEAKTIDEKEYKQLRADFFQAAKRR